MPKSHHITQEDYESALAANAERPRNPWAVDEVAYDAATECILMRFPGGVGLAAPLALISEFANVSKAALRKVYLSPAGETLCLDVIDAHISTRGLISDVLNRLPREVLASRLGAIGGAQASEAKRLAAVENGKKGGRPKKVAAA